MIKSIRVMTAVCALALLTVFLGASYRSIVIDGSNDFAADETFPGAAGSAWYVTWDADNLYVGISNSDIGSSSSPSKWVLWYFDTDPQPAPLSGSGSTTGVKYNTQQARLPFSANYHLRWKEDDSFIQLMRFDGSSWIPGDQSGIQHSRVGGYLEVKIPRAVIGSPAKIYLSGGMIQEASGNEWTYYLMPAGQTDGYDPTIAHFYGFSLGDGVAPNDPVNYDAPLPIQLDRFTATSVDPRSVQLNWSTLSEVNNYGFRVDREPAGAGIFVPIAGSFVGGHGTTLQKHEYSFVDTEAPAGLCSYRLEQIDLDGTTHYSDVAQVVIEPGYGLSGRNPGCFLGQNYPNPFNPATTIRYSLSGSSRVQFEIFNSSGQLVASLPQGVQGKGPHEARFDASFLPSGVYFYRLKAGGFVQTKECILLR